jgi:hypothetical protein
MLRVDGASFHRRYLSPCNLPGGWEYSRSMAIIHEIVEGLRDKDGPNFLVVVLWAGTALALGLVTALVVLSSVGGYLLPRS